MSTVESLAQNAAGQRQLKLMVALTELEPLDSRRQVNIDPLYEDAARWGLDEGAIESDLEVLKSNGWVDFFPDFDGIGAVTVAQPGVDAAEEFMALRSDLGRRAKEIRDAVLNWLYDHNLRGSEPLATSDFLASPKNHFLGDPYSQDELSHAEKWLLDTGYIEGIESFGSDLTRPNITTEGIRVIDTEHSVNHALTSTGATANEIHITDSQAVNVTVDSTNVTQSNTLTQERTKEVERALESVRAMLNPRGIGVTEETAAQAQIVTGQAQEEIQSSAPDAGKVKSLLSKLGELAATDAAIDVLLSFDFSSSSVLRYPRRLADTQAWESRQRPN